MEVPRVNLVAVLFVEHIQGLEVRNALGTKRDDYSWHFVPARLASPPAFARLLTRVQAWTPSHVAIREDYRTNLGRKVIYDRYCLDRSCVAEWKDQLLQYLGKHRELKGTHCLEKLWWCRVCGCIGGNITIVPVFWKEGQDEEERYASARKLQLL